MPAKDRRKHTGRIPALDALVHKKVVQLAAANVPKRYIADAVGVANSTLALWFAKGRKGGVANKIYSELLAEIKKVRAEAISSSVARIRKAAQGGAVIEEKTVTHNGVTTTTRKYAQPIWQADGWLLERQEPDEFAQNRNELKALQLALKEMETRLLVLTGGTDAAAKPATKK